MAAFWLWGYCFYTMSCYSGSSYQLAVAKKWLVLNSNPFNFYQNLHALLYFIYDYHKRLLNAFPLSMPKLIKLQFQPKSIFGIEQEYNEWGVHGETCSHDPDDLQAEVPYLDRLASNLDAIWIKIWCLSSRFSGFTAIKGGKVA